MRGIKQGNLDLLLAYLKMSPRKKSFRLDHIEKSPPHQSVNKTLETVPPPHSLATPRRRTESTDGGPAEALLAPAPPVIYRVRFDSNWGTIEIPIIGPKSYSQIVSELQDHSLANRYLANRAGELLRVAGLLLTVPEAPMMLVLGEGQ